MTTTSCGNYVKSVCPISVSRNGLASSPPCTHVSSARLIGMLLNLALESTHTYRQIWGSDCMLKKFTFLPSVQGWAKEWSLGCVNPASWLLWPRGASSHNLGTILLSSPVYPVDQVLCLDHILRHTWGCFLIKHSMHKVQSSAVSVHAHPRRNALP